MTDGDGGGGESRSVDLSVTLEVSDGGCVREFVFDSMFGCFGPSTAKDNRIAVTH